MATITFVSADNQVQSINVKVGISIQEAAIQNDIIGIDADCGGGCSCATCHIFVADEWREKVGPPGDLEASMLESVEGSKGSSRLACQVKIVDELDGLVVYTPEKQTGC
jgi:2Fe-2S ferredoxin